MRDVEKINLCRSVLFFCTFQEYFEYLFSYLTRNMKKC